MVAEILETDEEFEDRYRIMAAINPTSARWERQHRAYVLRDLKLREELTAAINTLAKVLQGLQIIATGRPERYSEAGE